MPIVVLMFWMGIYPWTFLRKMDASVISLVNRIQTRERVYVEDNRPGPRLRGVRPAALPLSEASLDQGAEAGLQEARFDD